MTTVMQSNDVKIITKTMEESSRTTVMKSSKANDAKATDILNAATKLADKKKKKRSPFGILKAAILMMRQRPTKKQAKNLVMDRQNSATKATPAITAAPNANWKNLVGSMRPLHLQEESPKSRSPKMTSFAESVEEIIPRPGSPAPSSSGTMSQYASASSLRDLDNSSDSEEDDPDEVFDAITGDEMIDSKAEEFIAQFYKQIKIQNTSTPTTFD